MKATVVVSCYNQEQYIEECLDSILAQAVDFEFDVLISDDCSTDSTAAIIQTYQLSRAKTINIIARSVNVGPAENYVKAHRQATGDIVFHIDGDDVMLPGKLQKQYDIFKNNDAVNLVLHRARYFSDDGSYVSDTGRPVFSQGQTMHFAANDLALWGSICVHSAFAYRKSSRRFERGTIDFMEWFFAMDSLLPTGEGVYIDEILVKYRCNPGGGAYLASKNGRSRAYRIYLDDVYYYFEKNPQLRPELYSNALVTALAMFKNGIYVNSILFFLAKNLFYFRPANVYKTSKMRLSVAPAVRTR